jgi:hypothetical protein
VVHHHHVVVAKWVQKKAENKNEKFPEENCKKKEAMKVNRTSESMN